MSRPRISPALLAQMTSQVPGRLLRKLDKKPDIAESWTWAQDGEQWRVQTSGDAVVTIEASVLREPEALNCSCLLAPKCLHRLAVASRLPLHDGEADASAVDSGVLEHAVGGSSRDGSLGGPSGSAAGGSAARAVSAVAKPSLPPELEAKPISQAEKAAALVASEALGAFALSGIGAAGAMVQAGLLRALHGCRAAGLFRLASLLHQLLELTRRHREGKEDAALRILELFGEAMALAFSLLDSEAVGAAHRGIARRRYVDEGPLKLWGLCCAPFWSRTGFSGVQGWLVDRHGTVHTAQSMTPAGGHGGRASLPVFENVTLSHGALSRGCIATTGVKRSFDRRLGGGQGAKAIATGPSSLFEGPPAALFEVPLFQQLPRSWESRGQPPLLRPAGDELLFFDAVLLPGERDELPVQTGALVLRALCPPEATGPYRIAFAALQRHPGARLRCIGRVVPGRERAVELLSVATSTLRWDLGFDDEQLPGEREPLFAMLEAAQQGCSDEPHGDMPAPIPLGPERRRLPHTALQQVAIQSMLGGWQALPASRRDELLGLQGALRGLGLTHGAGLLQALRQASLSQERHFSGRHLAPEWSPFATALAAVALYITQLEESAWRESWQRAFERAGA